MKKGATWPADCSTRANQRFHTNDNGDPGLDHGIIITKYNTALCELGWIGAQQTTEITNSCLLVALSQLQEDFHSPWPTLRGHSPITSFFFPSRCSLVCSTSELPINIRQSASSTIWTVPNPALLPAVEPISVNVRDQRLCVDWPRGRHFASRGMAVDDRPSRLLQKTKSY